MRTIAGVFVLVVATFAAWAADLPTALCEILLAQGATAAQIEGYFSAAKNNLYDSLRPELRRRLVKASVGMMSIPGENPGTMVFAGENWGATGVAHLWLLGVPPEEIAELTRPLIAGYLATRVTPGLLQLKKGNEFRSAAEALPELRHGSYPGIVRIEKGRLVEGNAQWGSALLSIMDRVSIDRNFSETVPGILAEHLQGALLAGLNGEAMTILDYMFLLDSADTSVIYSLEKLGLEKSLFQIGVKQFELGMQLIGRGQLTFELRNALAASVEAFARLPQGSLKLLANRILLAIGNLVSAPEFIALFPNPAEAKTTYYDIALAALMSTGHIAQREMVDSVRHELTFAGVDEPEVGRAIRRIADDYVHITNRVQEHQFEVLRHALVCIGDRSRLEHAGNEMLRRNKNWSETWQPYQPYGAAFAFYLAVANGELARHTLDIWVAELNPVPKIYTERPALLERDYEQILDRAKRVNYRKLIQQLHTMFAERKWEGLQKTAAAFLASDLEAPVEPEKYPVIPHFPSGLRSALRDTNEVIHHWDRRPLPSPGQRRTLILKGVEAQGADRLREAMNHFVSARSAPHLIGVGDALMVLHYTPRAMGRAHVAATAHEAYLLAALLEQHPELAKP